MCDVPERVRRRGKNGFMWKITFTQIIQQILIYGLSFSVEQREIFSVALSDLWWNDCQIFRFISVNTSDSSVRIESFAAPAIHKNQNTKWIRLWARAIEFLNRMKRMSGRGKSIGRKCDERKNNKQFIFGQRKKVIQFIAWNQMAVKLKSSLA